MHNGGPCHCAPGNAAGNATKSARATSPFGGDVERTDTRRLSMPPPCGTLGERLTRIPPCAQQVPARVEPPGSPVAMGWRYLYWVPFISLRERHGSIVAGFPRKDSQS